MHTAIRIQKFRDKPPADTHVRIVLPLPKSAYTDEDFWGVKMIRSPFVLLIGPVLLIVCIWMYVTADPTMAMALASFFTLAGIWLSQVVKWTDQRVTEKKIDAATQAVVEKTDEQTVQLKKDIPVSVAETAKEVAVDLAAQTGEVVAEKASDAYSKGFKAGMEEARRLAGIASQPPKSNERGHPT